MVNSSLFPNGELNVSSDNSECLIRIAQNLHFCVWYNCWHSGKGWHIVLCTFLDSASWTLSSREVKLVVAE